jgi:hypothetical protein
MQSGPLDVALLFQKPVLTLNMYDWIFGSPFKVVDRGLLKMVKVRGRPVTKTFKQRIELPFKFTNHNENISSDEAVYIDNSPEQIFEAVKEFYFDYVSGFSRQPSVNLIENGNFFRMTSERNLKDIIIGNGEIYSRNRVDISRLIYRNLASRGYYYDSFQ